MRVLCLTYLSPEKIHYFAEMKDSDHPVQSRSVLTDFPIRTPNLLTLEIFLTLIILCMGMLILVVCVCTWFRFMVPFQASPINC